MPKEFKLSGTPAIGPSQKVRIKTPTGWSYHFSQPMAEPTEEEIRRWHTDTVTWVEFNDKGISIDRGEEELSAVEMLVEIEFCGGCERKHLCVIGDYICVRCRYPDE